MGWPEEAGEILAREKNQGKIASGSWGGVGTNEFPDSIGGGSQNQRSGRGSERL